MAFLNANFWQKNQATHPYSPFLQQAPVKHIKKGGVPNIEIAHPVPYSAGFWST
jgi:hypothetical protein